MGVLYIEELTHERAANILAMHYVESKPSAKPGHIDALSESVKDGVAGFEWESVPLKVSALRDWLGY